MKAKDLIHELQKYDGETEVAIYSRPTGSALLIPSYDPEITVLLLYPECVFLKLIYPSFVLLWCNKFTIFLIANCFVTILLVYIYFILVKVASTNSSKANAYFSFSM